MLKILIVFLIIPVTAFAYFYNDSDVVELGTGTPKLLPEHPPGATGGSSGGGIITIIGGDGIDGSGAETEEEIPSEEGVSEGTADIDAATGDSSGDSSGGPIDTDEELFNLLLSGDALTGGNLTQISGATSDAFSGDLLGLGAQGGWSKITIQGWRVREILRGKFSLHDLLASWREGKNSGLNARGFGLFAAATAAKDANIDTITFSADAFEITYRSRGYLLAVIPISFPVRVTIVPDVASERVRIKLPWYRFFVRKFFKVKTLSSEIDSLIAGKLKENVDSKESMSPILLEAVSEFLRKKVGTVGGTI